MADFGLAYITISSKMDLFNKLRRIRVKMNFNKKNFVPYSRYVITEYDRISASLTCYIAVRAIEVQSGDYHR